MFVLFGYETKNTTEEWCETGICAGCKNASGAHLVQKYNCFSIFSVPVTKTDRKYFISCDSCGALTPIPEAGYKELKANFYSRLDKGAFPAAVIEKEFSPENTKYAKKTSAFAGILLCALIALIFLALFLTSPKSLAESAVVAAAALAVVVLAVLEGWRNYSFSKKCRRLYDGIKQKSRMHPER